LTSTGTISSSKRPASRAAAAGERDVGLARLDRLRGGDDRLHPGPAQAVDRVGGDLLGDTGLHPDHPRHVHVGALGVDDVAEHDVLDLVGIDPGSRERRDAGGRAEIARWHAGQALAVGADRGPRRGGDDDVVHLRPFARLTGRNSVAVLR